MSYTCYLLTNGYTNTYIGSTNNFKRRLRQHNKEIKGGARYTSKFITDKGWSPVILIDGFETQSCALSFEWRMKRALNTKGKLKRVSGLENRIDNIFHIIESGTVTSKCCPVSELGELIIKVNTIYFDKALLLFNNIKLNTECENSVANINIERIVDAI